jgi:biopolymer transport protein ExbB/TolQ
MGWGAFLLVRLREPTIRLALHRFPFPMRYKIYYINMGLLGTIVGFVIAFSDVNPRAEGQSTVLLDALGTALWSTLTAIFLAYMFCPLMEVVYNGLGRLRFGEIPAADPASQISRLQHRTDAAISAFERLTGSVRTLTGELDHQSWVVRLSEAEGRLAALIDKVAPLEQQAVNLSGEVERLGEAVEQIRTASGKASQSMEARIERLERRIEDLFHGFRKVLG